jgi:molecular chaperone GrpE
MTGEPAPAEAGPEPQQGDPATEPTTGEGRAPRSSDLTVEDLVNLVESLTAERDASLESRARLQAEFENYRKRVAKQELDQTARAAEALVGKLLPIFDAFEAALAHAVEGVEPIWSQMRQVLEREGLQRLDPTGEPFDPTLHEAVAHEPGDGDHPVVSDVFRSGYAWKGRVLRPAMVKVRD